MGNSGFRTHAGIPARRGNPACLGGPGGDSTPGGPFPSITLIRKSISPRASARAGLARVLGILHVTSGEGGGRP